MTTQLPSRLWEYLKERFNPVSMGLVAVMLGLGLGLGATSIEQPSINMGRLVLVVMALFLFLLRLRLFDEFKDAKHDQKYYPERPVPRGLVKLDELRGLMVLVGAAEGLIAIGGGAAPAFVGALLYSLLMFKEFGVRKWLLRHFTVYVISHEVLLIPLFWYLFRLAGGEGWGREGVILTFVVSATALFALEVARKFRAPENENGSRNTYTSQYGLEGAGLVLVATISINAAASWALISRLEWLVPQMIGWLVSVVVVTTNIKKPTKKLDKKIMMATGVYTLVSQLTLIGYWIIFLNT